MNFNLATIFFIIVLLCFTSCTTYTETQEPIVIHRGVNNRNIDGSQSSSVKIHNNKVKELLQRDLRKFLNNEYVIKYYLIEEDSKYKCKKATNKTAIYCGYVWAKNVKTNKSDFLYFEATDINILLLTPVQKIIADTKRQMRDALKRKSNLSNKSINNNETKSNYGLWAIKKQNSIMGDKAKASIVKTSEIKYFSYYVKKYATLHVGFDGKEKFIAVLFDVILDNDYYGNAYVEYKIDDQKIKKGNWNINADYKAVFAKNPTRLLKEIINNNKFAVRVLRNRSSDQIEVYFDISDLPQAFAQIQDTCNWK